MDNQLSDLLTTDGKTTSNISKFISLSTNEPQELVQHEGNQVLSRDIRNGPVSKCEKPLSLYSRNNNYKTDAGRKGLKWQFELFTELCFAKQYALTEKLLGRGTYGQVYLGTTTEGDDVAIKFTKSSNAAVDEEFKVYNKLSGVAGIPTVFEYKSKGDEEVLIMQLLGSSLAYKIMKKESHDLMSLAQQLITTVYAIHLRGILHRDIKPDNIVMGKGINENKAYLIDFGLAREDFRVLGLSPSSDLLDLGFVFICLWENVNLRKYNMVEDFRNHVKGMYVRLPVALIDYFDYCFSLKIHDIPDYPFLISLFQ